MIHITGAFIVVGAFIVALLLNGRPARAAEVGNVAADTQADNQSAASSGGTLDEIVVTAQKRAERAVDVPATLTIVNGDDLPVGAGVSNLALTYVIPGLKVDRSGVNTEPAIRGISSLVSAPGIDPNVATYIDGVYLSATDAVLDLPDVRDIEVLKGPQGTLFGRNATGGAILITTLGPSFTPSGSASVSYGNFNDQAFKGFITGPLIADKLAGSLSLYEETNNGYLQDIINGGHPGKMNADVVRGKLLYTPTENANVTLTAYYSHRSDPATLYVTPYQGDSAAQLQPGAIVPTKPYDIATNRPDFSKETGYGVSLVSVIHTDPGTLTILAAYDNHYDDFSKGVYAAYAPAGGIFYESHQVDENESFEANFASKQYEHFNYIAGIFLYHDIAAYDPLQVISDIPSYALSIFGFQGDYSYAGFSEVNYKLTDRITATAGIRYSSEYREVQGNGTYGLLSSPATPLLDHGNKTFCAWTPRISLSYALRSDTNVYFTYSQGFKSGGYDPSAIPLFGPGDIAAVKPEKLTAYEVGIKSAPTRRTNFTASAFYYDYTNQQVDAFVPLNGVPLNVTENAASSKIYGIDLEGSVPVTDDLRVHTGISVLHARFASFPNAVVSVPNYQLVNGVSVPVGNNQLAENVTGNELPRTPDWTVSIGGDYVREFASGTLTVRADVFESDKFYFDVGNVFKQPTYTHLDASAAWTLPGDHWTFTLWGKNLTNSIIINQAYSSEYGTGYGWAPPREYGATVSVKF
jgi:iron complex outermembrane recepter protein